MKLSFKFRNIALYENHVEQNVSKTASFRQFFSRNLMEKITNSEYWLPAKNMQEKWCRDAAYTEPGDAMTTKTELHDHHTESY